jgi:hypothetical protein
MITTLPTALIQAGAVLTLAYLTAWALTALTRRHQDHDS